MELKKNTLDVGKRISSEAIDVDVIRDYIRKRDGDKKPKGMISNRARQGTILADFDPDEMEENKNINTTTGYEIKEKIGEEYKRRLETSENKYRLSKESMNDKEKALLLATEASKVLYEQFIKGCKSIEVYKYEEILNQKVMCMLLIGEINYEQKNYKETIIEMNKVKVIYYKCSY